jgi:hypothetical protein
MTKPIDIEALRRNLDGCGDNGCLIRKPTGMATNGGCRCFGERSTFKKVGEMAATMSVLLDELEAAREKIRGLRDAYRGHVITFSFGEKIRCDACGNDWDRQGAELHDAGCLAAAEEGA